jgi:branched-chain amino acid transport system ATP-binding protein
MTAPANSAPLLTVRGLTKRYYGLTAVDALSFSVPAGSIVGLIGPNGSGKSSTIDCISGFQTPDHGEWFLDGRSLTGLPPSRHAMAGLTRTFQAVRAYDEITLIDNLSVAAQEHDGQGWWAAFSASPALRQAEASAVARGAELLALVGLGNYAEAPAAILSYGQRKLLAIAAALMPRPKLIVLDEPVAGVNPAMIRSIEDIIRRLNSEGTTLLIVEHNMDFIMNLCQHVIVLDQGRKIAEGSPALVRNDPIVLAAYIGTAPESAANA